MARFSGGPASLCHAERGKANRSIWPMNGMLLSAWSKLSKRKPDSSLLLRMTKSVQHIAMKRVTACQKIWSGPQMKKTTRQKAGLSDRQNAGFSTRQKAGFSTLLLDIRRFISFNKTLFQNKQPLRGQILIDSSAVLGMTNLSRNDRGEAIPKLRLRLSPGHG